MVSRRDSQRAIHHFIIWMDLAWGGGTAGTWNCWLNETKVGKKGSGPVPEPLGPVKWKARELWMLWLCHSEEWWLEHSLLCWPPGVLDITHIFPRESAYANPCHPSPSSCQGICFWTNRTYFFDLTWDDFWISISLKSGSTVRSPPSTFSCFSRWWSLWSVLVK